MVKDFKGSFSSIVDLNDNTKLFTISLETDINFKAGQFVNLVFDMGGKKVIKPYSIASSTLKKNEIELCINLVPNGKVTPHLFNMDIEDEVNVKGPLGLFNLESLDTDKVVFIATGTGVAPLKSMIYELLEKESQKEILLIFGCRYENSILFNDEFEELESNYSNFKFIKLISRPSDEWVGRVGYVQDNFDLVDVLNSSFYICGLPNMVEDSKNKLVQMGASEDKIYFEKYV